MLHSSAVTSMGSALLIVFVKYGFNSSDCVCQVWVQLFWLCLSCMGSAFLIVFVRYGFNSSDCVCQVWVQLFWLCLSGMGSTLLIVFVRYGFNSSDCVCQVWVQLFWLCLSGMGSTLLIVFVRYGFNSSDCVCQVWVQLFWLCLSGMGSTLLIVFVRYELRVRYLPRSFQELYSRDKVTFYYLYDQVGESMRERERGWARHFTTGLWLKTCLCMILFLFTLHPPSPSSSLLPSHPFGTDCGTQVWEL